MLMLPVPAPVLLLPARTLRTEAMCADRAAHVARVARGTPQPDNVYCDDALTFLRSLPTGSVDAVITDPPYPEISRDYGRMTEAAWLELMKAVVLECKRMLKPKGSALFVLQPNSETVGRMRSWLWRFLVWLCDEWNIVQDAYWWNFAQPPTVHVQRIHGLMRPSVKTLVWCGAPDCYRNQGAVLWKPSDATFASDKSDMALQVKPSGLSIRPGRAAATAIERGGSTPYNLLPIANTNSVTSAGANGHGAGTPLDLVDWWVRYLTRPGDLVCDPFAGSGTTLVAARNLGRHYIGCDISSEYVAIARERLAQPYTLPLLVEDPPAPVHEQKALDL